MGANSSMATSVLLHFLLLFACLPLPCSSISPFSGPVLVLGSDGLIGTAITAWLHLHHYSTILIHNRSHVDLRDPSALPSHLSSLSIPPSSISYAFFLACEVGGSRFLSSPSSHPSILTHNLDLYHSLLPFLTAHSIPYTFTSSYLAHSSSPYATIKRLGELLAHSLSPTLHTTLRLYNVYGPEQPHPIKAHVLTDWVRGCVGGVGEGIVGDRVVRSVTDGWEWRQFMWVGDVAEAMGRMMEAREGGEGGGVLRDVSSGVWVQMREVARVVEEVAREGGGCTVEFTEGVSGDIGPGGDRREKVEPDMSWQTEQGWGMPKVGLVEGVRELFRVYGGEEWKRRVAAVTAAMRNATAYLYPTSSTPPYSIRTTSQAPLS